jgi:hypothetical protein
MNTMTNEVIKKGETIYLCYQNPINHSWLVHDEDTKFSILTLEQVQDNKEGYVFIDDVVINEYIKFFLHIGFELNELIELLPTTIDMMQFIRKDNDN